MTLLETKELTKNFGSLRAIDRLNFLLASGETRAVIGPNGAGKTTLINLLMGELSPDAGEIFFERRRISRLSSHRVARRGIARTFQIVNLFPNLTVEENIRAAAQVSQSWLRWSRSARQITERVLTQVRLRDKSEQRARELSHGDQRLLEIGIALAQEPKLLLLDEPTAGLSPVETQAMIELIGQLEKMAILIVEHDMNVVLALADKITVLHRGQILAEGLPAEIQANAQVQEVYLRRSQFIQTKRD
ncbi:ABC transporter ATP-binding protein [Candidatus Acetothermia bacterium]|nr:ABC transporter ATP-binding protein [Candidatus Acetothermia bacterium]